jgi:hypothetical protein
MSFDLFSGKKGTSGFKVTGDETSKKGFSNLGDILPGGLNGDIGDIFAGTDFDLKEVGKNGEIYIKHPTKDKVDLVARFDGTPLNISVKNYDLSSHRTEIGIVGDTSPLILLNDYGYLISHYLNVASEHGYWNKEQEEYYQNVI